MSIMNKDILDMSQQKYLNMIDSDDYAKTSDGKIKLIPSEYKASKDKADLTTNISLLEEKLKNYKEEKTKIEKVQTEYVGRKKKKKKKVKKEKDTILKMIFNNADTRTEEREEEAEDEYRDIKDKGSKKKQKTDNVDSKYGQRFSPVISLLYDTINEFDDIIVTIENDLEAAGSARTRYKTDQMGNLISAKNAKLSAIKEIGSLSKTISDLEYKAEKDSSKDVETESSKALTQLGVKFLKGSFGDDDDDEDEDFKIRKKNSDRELATEFAKSIFDKKKDIKLTSYEKHIGMEGKYTLVVVADNDDIEGTWKFSAIDNKGKEIKNFRTDYKDLVPKKKDVKLVFDLNKMKVLDKNISKTYKLILR